MILDLIDHATMLHTLCSNKCWLSLTKDRRLFSERKSEMTKVDSLNSVPASE